MRMILSKIVHVFSLNFSVNISIVSLIRFISSFCTLILKSSAMIQPRFLQMNYSQFLKNRKQTLKLIKSFGGLI
jgi:hypothetical protein